jgi:cell division protein FtsL
MFPTAMRTALLQATALCTISMILDHHTRGLVFDAVWGDESFTNMFNAVNISASERNKTKSGQITLDAGETSNTTIALDHTADSFNATARHPFDMPSDFFYSHTLPRELFIFVVISALQYWWHTFLERILPGRAKSKFAPSEKEAEHSEGREEEIVQRWIAQGRLHRASLSWCNTFLKWMVEMTVGRLWYHTVEYGIRWMFKSEDPTLPFYGLKHVRQLFHSSNLNTRWQV